MSDEHTDGSDATPEIIGPVVDDVQAMHAEALAQFEDEGDGEVEPEVDEGQPDGEPEAAAESDDDDAGDDGDYEAEADGTDDVDTPDEKEAEQERLRQADYTRKTQELAEQRKEFEADRQRLNDLMQELEKRTAAPPPEPVKAPVRPGDDASNSDWVDYNEKYIAYQAQIAAENSPQAQQYREMLAQQEQQRQIAEAGQKSLAHIRARKDYSEEVENRMGQVVQTDQFWAQNIYSTEGADKLFDLVSKQIAEESAAQKADKKTRRAAGASKGKVNPPGSKSRVRPPQKPAADMSIEELQAEARRMSGVS